MRGVAAYDCKAFHKDCPDGAVYPVDIAGLPYLWCDHCRSLCRLEAVSPKYQTWEAARSPRTGRPVPSEGEVKE